MKRHYILIETDNIDSTFTIEGRHYEIYFISSIKIDENLWKNQDIIVLEINQADAFKSLRKKYKNLFKYSSKEFYEKELILKV